MFIIGQYEITLRKIKTFLGNEGHGLNADIYVNGKKLATVIDHANGGPVDYDIVGFGTPQYGKNKKMFQDIADELLSLPKMEARLSPEDKEPFFYHWDWDCVVDHEVDAFHKEKERRRLERRMDNHIIYGKPGGNEYWEVKLGTAKHPISIAELMQTDKGIEVVKNTFVKWKQKAAAVGKQILNTNIPKEWI